MKKHLIAILTFVATALASFAAPGDEVKPLSSTVINIIAYRLAKTDTNSQRTWNEVHTGISKLLEGNLTAAEVKELQDATDYMFIAVGRGIESKESTRYFFRGLRVEHIREVLTALEVALKDRAALLAKK